jgi:uncharacterized ferritin-like protein (DUF455 family)
MEIREFAERVLYSPTLTDKLEVPGRLTDVHPGASCQATPLPARPPGLDFAPPETARAVFPKSGTLVDPTARGRALHFFANHELLALELMALALLRFPDAPSSFRKRLVATMRDEQTHMSLYLERMAALGVELGSVPLNSFFWDLISPMGKPMDFIAAMSLTFEQANLDFSLHYRDAFQAVGDTETAGIMDRVLLDEVAHVRHGVRFFETWRDPSLTQWEAYQEALTFPLTPARAKGIGFTAQHRRDAGLDDDFIDRLRVYSHSKGRPPRILLFNPDTEVALGRQAKGHTPPAQVVAMARDLETLPLFVMAREDVLLVRGPPRPAFLAGLQERGYASPECVAVNLEARRFPTRHPLVNRRIAELCPWGWDPRSAEFLQPLAGQLKPPIDTLQAVVQRRAHLGSKSWLAKQLPALLNTLDDARRACCVVAPLPTVAGHADEVDAQCAQLHNAGHPLVVVKAPYGTAGRGAQRIPRTGAATHQRRWIEDTLATQGSVSIEPWYERVLDLSYLFKLRADGALTEVGFNPFFTDASGRYRGAILGHLKLALDDELRAFVHRATSDAQWLWHTVRQVAHELATPMHAAGFTGPAGLDMMIVRDKEGALKLRVPLELNPRCTMGHVAMALARPLGSRSAGLWLLLNRKDLRASGHGDFGALIAQLEARLPTAYHDTSGPLKQGAFATNDAHHAEQLLGVAIVAATFKDALSAAQDVGLSDPTRRPILQGLPNGAPP